MDKKINVLIKPDKSIFVETDNFKGEACVTAIKELFESFLEIKDFELKSDYYDGDVIINNEVKIKK